MKYLPFFCSITLVVVVTACGGTRSVDNRMELAYKVADHAGFKPLTIKTTLFKLFGFYSFKSNSSDISVFFEGDGFAWVDRYTISRNPTPRNPLSLKLAAVDQADNIIYLARPCQYVDIRLEPNCDKKYWTSHRFSREVIDSYHQALDQISSNKKATKFHLIGFSGGAAIATLLAEQREDISSLITIGGNLDHVKLNNLRKVSPLSGSLDPMRAAEQLKMLPQIHYSGENDKVIPYWVAVGFSKAVGSPCAKSQKISGVGHLDGWDEIWSQLGSKIPTC